jgi:hypothetical protein
LALHLVPWRRTVQWSFFELFLLTFCFTVKYLP